MLVRNVERYRLFDMVSGTLPVSRHRERVTEGIVRQQEECGVFDLLRQGEQLLAQLNGRLVLRAAVPITPEAIDDREELWSVPDLLTQVARSEVDCFHFRRSPAHRTHQRRAQRRPQPQLALRTIRSIKG